MPALYTLLLILLVTLTSCASRPKPVPATRPNSATRPARAEAPPPKPQFPIMIWDYVPADPAVLKDIRDAGVTIACFVPVANLDAVHAAGLQAIVNDPRSANYDWLSNLDDAKVRANIKSLTGETKNHPAVFGYYLRDEPPAAYYPQLAKVARAIHEFAPGKWAYVNLFPNYATAGQMNVPTYEQYVEDFVRTCKPRYLSYDHYALMEDGSLRDGYFQNLEQMSAASRKHGVPFWNIVLSNCHFAYQEPSATGLRFQAYTTLAYGAKGLAYFTYFAPNVGNYRLAPVDQFGHKTPTYYHFQNANLQVQALAPHLLKLKHDDTYHFGQVPSLAHGPREDSLVVNVPGQYVVGDFTHEDGFRYVLLVNKDRTHSAFCEPTFRTAPSKIEKISPYSGDPVPFEGEQRWLAAGQGVLLRLAK